MNQSDVLSLCDGNKAVCRRVVRQAGDLLRTDEQHVISLIAQELGVDEREIQLKRHPKRARDESEHIAALQAIASFMGTLRPSERELRVYVQNVAMSHVRALDTQPPTYGISERARHLGIEIPRNMQFTIGRDVLSAYMNCYKKRPQQRVFLTESNESVLMNCYSIEECHQVVDQVLREYEDSPPSSSESVFSSEE
jgi:hypothetical protein